VVPGDLAKWVWLVRVKQVATAVPVAMAARVVWVGLAMFRGLRAMVAEVATAVRVALEVQEGSVRRVGLVAAAGPVVTVGPVGIATLRMVRVAAAVMAAGVGQEVMLAPQPVAMGLLVAAAATAETRVTVGFPAPAAEVLARWAMRAMVAMVVWVAMVVLAVAAPSRAQTRRVIQVARAERAVPVVTAVNPWTVS
jgi:hypothetical protein